MLYILPNSTPAKIKFPVLQNVIQVSIVIGSWTSEVAASVLDVDMSLLTFSFSHSQSACRLVKKHT
jgi:hypothetical protein